MAVTTDIVGQDVAVKCDVCPLLLEFLKPEAAADSQLTLNTIKVCPFFFHEIYILRL